MYSLWISQIQKWPHFIFSIICIIAWVVLFISCFYCLACVLLQNKEGRKEALSPLAVQMSNHYIPCSRQSIFTFLSFILINALWFWLSWVWPTSCQPPPSFWKKCFSSTVWADRAVRPIHKARALSLVCCSFASGWYFDPKESIFRIEIVCCFSFSLPVFCCAAIFSRIWRIKKSVLYYLYSLLTGIPINVLNCGGPPWFNLSRRSLIFAAHPHTTANFVRSCCCSRYVPLNYVLYRKTCDIFSRMRSLRVPCQDSEGNSLQSPLYIFYLPSGKKV